MSENETTTGPDDFGDMFDSWIAGATLAEKSVDIYGRPDLQAEYEVLDREMDKAAAALKAAIAAAEGAEASLEDTSDVEIARAEVERIENLQVDLYEKWMASKSTWFVRALPSEIGVEIGKDNPEVPDPGELKTDATIEEKNDHAAAVKAHKKAADDRNFAILPHIVRRIEWADGRSVEAVYADDGVRFQEPVITSEQLRKLRTRLGDIQYLRLLSASHLANMQEPVVPAPFLRASSKTDKT